MHLPMFLHLIISFVDTHTGSAFGLAGYALSVWVSDDLDERDHTD